MNSQDLIKAIVQQVGSLIDARNKTLEANLKVYIDQTINTHIKASEKRQNKRLKIISEVIRIDLKDGLTRTENKLTRTEDKLGEEIRTLRKGVAKKWQITRRKLKN